MDLINLEVGDLKNQSAQNMDEILIGLEDLSLDLVEFKSTEINGGIETLNALSTLTDADFDLKYGVEWEEKLTAMGISVPKYDVGTEGYIDTVKTVGAVVWETVVKVVKAVVKFIMGLIQRFKKYSSTMSVGYRKLDKIVSNLNDDDYPKEDIIKTSRIRSIRINNIINEVYEGNIDLNQGTRFIVNEPADISVLLQHGCSILPATINNLNITAIENDPDYYYIVASNSDKLPKVKGRLLPDFKVTGDTQILTSLFPVKFIMIGVGFDELEEKVIPITFAGKSVDEVNVIDVVGLKHICAKMKSLLKDNDEIAVHLNEAIKHLGKMGVDDSNQSYAKQINSMSEILKALNSDGYRSYLDVHKAFINIATLMTKQYL